MGTTRSRTAPGKADMPPPLRPGDRGGGDARLLGALMLAAGVLTAGAHWTTLSAKALCFDDNQYLIGNTLVQHPGWHSAKRFLTEVLEPSTVQGYYQPLTMISLMADAAMGGGPDSLRAFHRTSLALHVMNVLLVILLLYLLFGRAWPAALAGVLWGVHPLTVEPIPWVGERKTLLATFFALLAIFAYVRYARRGLRGWYAGCLLCSILAMMSKPTTTPLPVLLVLLDYWPLRRLNRSTLVEKLPLLAISICFAVITYVSQDRTAAVRLPSEYPPSGIPLILCHNIVFYLCKMAWPVHLTPHYAYPVPLSLSSSTVLAGVLGSCLLLVALAASLLWTRAAVTSWLFFFAAIFPTMGVIGFTNVIASDKYAYLPSLGVLILLCWLLCVLWGRLERFTRPRGSAGKAAVVLVAVVVFWAESRQTRAQLAHWQDTVHLFDYMLTLTPDSALVHNNLGNVLCSSGHVDEAIMHYRRAVLAEPRFGLAHYNLGLRMAERGDWDEAVAGFQRSLALLPDFADAQVDLANALVRKNRPQEAEAHYRRAIKSPRCGARARCNLAALLVMQGRCDEAITLCREAIAMNGSFADAHRNLAEALGRKGMTDEAIVEWREVVRLQPQSPQSHFRLGDAQLAGGRAEEAVAQYRIAVQLAPKVAVVRNNLASALAELDRTDEAVSQWNEAIRLDPNYYEPRFNLAKMMLHSGKLDEAIRQFEAALTIAPESAEAKRELDEARVRANRPATLPGDHAAASGPTDRGARDVAGQR